MLNLIYSYSNNRGKLLNEWLEILEKQYASKDDLDNYFIQSIKDRKGKEEDIGIRVGFFGKLNKTLEKDLLKLKQFTFSPQTQFESKEAAYLAAISYRNKVLESYLKNLKDSYLKSLKDSKGE